nr:hypothetical protein [Vibrio ulleungensis]
MFVDSSQGAQHYSHDALGRMTKRHLR